LDYRDLDGVSGWNRSQEGGEGYQNGLASSLYAIQSQEEGWSILLALVLSAVYFQPLKDKWDAILSLVVLNLGHSST
jgi:hypothetical protein